MHTSSWKDIVQYNYLKILERVEKAKSAPYVPLHEDHAVCLIAVTKYQPLDVFSTLLESVPAIEHIAESRAIEAIKRKEQLYPLDQYYTWHFIGALQKNKVLKVINNFEYIHSVDSCTLAQYISHLTAQHKVASKQKIFLQVNPLQEKTKQGFSIDALHPKNSDTLYTISQLTGVDVQGLMVMAPQKELYGAYAVEKAFNATYELFSSIQQQKDIVFPSWRSLSMGMSSDYELAIRYGATHIRIGSYLFQ